MFEDVVLLRAILVLNLRPPKSLCGDVHGFQLAIMKSVLVDIKGSVLVVLKGRISNPSYLSEDIVFIQSCDSMVLRLHGSAQLEKCILLHKDEPLRTRISEALRNLSVRNEMPLQIIAQASRFNRPFEFEREIPAESITAFESRILQMSIALKPSIHDL